MPTPDDSLLITPAALQARLGDPALRILDCSTTLVPQPVGASKVVSGRPDFDAGHIPGAQHVDLVDDLSRPGAPYPYTLPEPAQIEALLGRLGITPAQQLVLYGRGMAAVVTRAWYVLHVMGHARLALLDGGFERWQREGRPVSTVVEAVPPTRYRASPRAGLLADQAEVQAAIGQPGVRLVNALGRDQFAGSGGAHYGRPGRIPGSLSLPARELLDPATQTFLPAAELRERFAALGIDAGAPDAPRVISYCGGGIAASATAFALQRLGHHDWAVYDNSLLEWATQPGLPMETG